MKVIRECNEAKFALFKDGPSIMHIKSLGEEISIILNLERSINNLSKRMERFDSIDGGGNRFKPLER